MIIEYKKHDGYNAFPYPQPRWRGRTLGSAFRNMNTIISRMIVASVLVKLCVVSDAALTESFDSTSTVSDPQLAEHFQSPPPVQSRTWVWWRWLNGAVSKKGITLDLEAMRDKGIGGAVVFDSGDAGTDLQPKGPPFMSDQWRALFKHALSEAERCGITISFNVCSGWDAGGPWVTPEQAIRKLISVQTVVNGPGRVTVALPKPPALQGYYRDIALLAMPKEEAAWTRSKALDLTRFMNPDGVLNWDAPAGSWRLLRIGYTLDGHKTVVAGSGPNGWEIDPLSSEAMDLHFAETVAKLAADAGPLAGKVFQYVSIDSWEIGQPTWTANMCEEFQKRRGYDLTPWLPALLGQTVDNPEETRRVFQDYQRTIADLVADHYYGRLRELSVKAGLKGTTSEPGGPGRHWIDALQCLGREDVPMGEFWTRQYEPDGPVELYGKNNKVMKAVAAAAHIYGKEICQAESFTSLADDLTETPWSMKELGDSAFCDGLTRMVFSSYISQLDPARKPGIYWQHIGISLGYNLTWWPMAEGWLTYLARCQHLLRQGLFVADFAYLQSETIPAYPPARGDQKPLRPAGFDYDPLNAEVLLSRVSASNGRLTLPDGMSYRYLVLPHDTNAFLSDAALKKVNELAAAGVSVIGPEKFSDRVAKMRQGKLDEIVNADGLKPDVEIRNASKDASFDWIHRRSGAAEIYFVSNQSSDIANEVKADITFRVSNKVPDLWDAVTGRIRLLPEYKTTPDGRTQIPMAFAPRQSWFVVFSGRSQKSEDRIQNGEKNFPEMKPVQELAGAWTVQFDPKWFYPDNGTGGKVSFEKLEDWTLRSEEAIKYYSGTAMYRKTFDFPTVSSFQFPVSKLFLDLGVVQNLARVKLNGRDLGIVWTAPWRVEIPSGVLNEKANELEIEVANCWPNRLIGDGLLPKEKRRTISNIRTYDQVLSKDGWIGTGDWARSNCKSCEERMKNGAPPKLLPSGLMGPVKLLREE